MAIAGATSTWKHATHGSPSSNTDYTAKTMSVTPTFDGEEVDSTTWGDAYRESEQTFKSHAYTVRYKYDATIWTVIGDLWSNGTAITFELSPVGTGSGNPKVTGSMYCRSFSQPFNVGDLQVMEVQFKGTGAPTFGTH